MKDFGKMTISEAMPHLKSVAHSYQLRLNRVKEFKLARTILINIYCTQWA